MATFAYGRVSTSLEDKENQRLELASASDAIDFWFADTISGKSATSQSAAFKELLTKIRNGETLLATKLDRLRRDAIDVLEPSAILVQGTLNRPQFSRPLGVCLWLIAACEVNRTG